MNAEIICVTAEGFPAEHSGFIASYISKKLFELGHRTLFESNCTPDADLLLKQLSQGISRSDIIILLGGIEPETGFAAKRALSSLAGVFQVENTAALESVKNYCASIGAELGGDHYSAASAPEGAEIFKNELGLCPGISLTLDSKRVILLPYAEGELTHMFETYVAPTLSGHGITASRIVNVIGLGEAEIEAKLSHLSNRSEFALNVLRRGVEYAVHVSSVADTKAAAESLCNRAVASVSVALGKAAFAVDSKGIQYEAVERLREKGLSASTAESCTGGMVSEMLTDVSGSSKVFEYGISAYSNRIKTEVLKVPESIITSYSAISRETAMYMAKNVRELGSSTIGISITGNAGPSASEGKSVGLVYVGIADAENYMVVELNLSPNLSREDIRAEAAATALDLIRRYAESYPSPLSGMIKYNEKEGTPVVPVAAPVIPKPAAPAPDEVKKEVSLPKVKESEQPIAEAFEKKNSADSDFTLIFDREDESGFVTGEDREYDFISSNKYKTVLAGIWTSVIAFLSNLSKIFPVKGDNPKRIIMKSVFLLSLITLITSATVICVRLTADSRERSIIAAAQERWNFDGEREKDGTFTAFTPFIEENKDIKGWITVPGTKVDNPVYQTTDNDYYLTHNMNKEKSRYGAIFFDYRCSLDPAAPSQNVTVYGHNMKDGSMFGTLKSYKKLDFYKANPTFTVTGLSEQSTYKIFAVMVMNATAADDNGYLYNYTSPSFDTQGSFIKWVNEARERSLINTTVDVCEHDRIITLVTCTNDFSNARLVIMARMTRYGESENVSTKDAVLNPNPRYPQAWYDKHKKPGFNGVNSSDTSSSNTTSTDNSSNENSSEGSSSDISSGDTSSGASSDTPSSDVSSSDTSNTTPPSSEDPPAGDDPPAEDPPAEGENEESKGEDPPTDQDSDETSSDPVTA